MAIDTAHFKQLLLDKRTDLTREIANFDEDARDSRTAEVEDPIDAVVSSEAKSLAFGGSNTAAEMLEQVDAALQRIETGEYGICVDCGEPIEPKRLEAVPWTPYCLKDQEKHDRIEAEATQMDSTL
ncbi:MAG TPA: TraR/DksA family transcriptional regulator [Bryobacteraceae bacterium]|jgi:DnaK suppressor protein|nr:TraR/DksA family transcriptional regulator [Bryobacteraceae bacterium]